MCLASITNFGQNFKMSADEEVELRDLVAQALELNGSLPNIMAQLRANIFLALDEDLKISKQQPLLNIKVKSHLETPEGQLMFCLVREFLEYFDLDCTASVYEPESYVGNFYKYEGRERIMQDLGLENSFSGPLLLHLVKVAQMKTKTLQINLTHINEPEKDSTETTVTSPIAKLNGHSFSRVDDAENDKQNEVNSHLRTIHDNNNHINANGGLVPANLDATFVKRDIENDDTFNGTSSIEEESVSGSINSDSKSHKLITNEEDLNISEQESTDTKLKSDERLKSYKTDMLKSKLDLPPFQMNKSRGNDILPSLYCKELKDRTNREYDFEIKDDYEEDFISGTELDLSQSKIEILKPPLEEQHSYFSNSIESLPKNSSKSLNEKIRDSDSSKIETHLTISEEK